MIRPLATLCAVFVAAVVIATAATASSAQAYHLTSTSAAADHHLNILRWPPRNPSFRPCIKGTVNLQSDEYLEGAYIVSEKHREKPDIHEAPIIPPAAGTYSWEVCRGWNPHVPESLGGEVSAYQVRSTLTGHGWSHTILNSFGIDDSTGSVEFPEYLHGNGYYEWGGRIVLRESPGVTHPSE